MTEGQKVVRKKRKKKEKSKFITDRKTGQKVRFHKETNIEKIVREFLTANNIEFIQEFEVKYRKWTKYYDFLIYIEINGQMTPVVAEINGNYWHPQKRLENKEQFRLTKFQKHAIRNDKLKKYIAEEIGLPLIVLWEDDILAGKTQQVYEEELSKFSL